MSARTFFRAMLANDDGLPAIGGHKNMLGIRPGVDVKTPMAGPGCGGLSVTADDPSRIFPGVLPKPFGGLNAETVMFETPDATFGSTSGLAVGAIHPKKLHAVVEAATIATIDDFQTRLAKTQASWSATQAPTIEDPR